MKAQRHLTLNHQLTKICENKLNHNGFNINFNYLIISHIRKIIDLKLKYQNKKNNKIKETIKINKSTNPYKNLQQNKTVPF